MASAALTIPASPALAGFLVGFSYDRPVEITNTSSGLRADVIWAELAFNWGVFLWPNNASRSQEFDALRPPAGNFPGSFRLRARHSGLCLGLDAKASWWRNGTLVVQRECNPWLASLYWRVRAVEDRVVCDGDVCKATSGIYPTLQNRYTGRCLHATNPWGGRPPERAMLVQSSCIRAAGDPNARSQLFSVTNAR